MNRLFSIEIDYGRIPYDDNGFVDWMIDAEPGAAAAYYRGHLGRDREKLAKIHDDEKRQRLLRIAKRALLAEQEGSVRLVQRRIAEHDYVYLMVRASMPIGRRVR